MSAVRPIVSDKLRVVVCLLFDQRAPPGDVSAFKRLVRSWGEVIESCDLTGSFDFMFEACLPDIQSYYLKLESVKEPLSRLVARYEANFVCRRFVRMAADAKDHAIWVPCHQGLKRIDSSLIDQVTAEGDYMRVHCGRDSWMVHMTMRNMRAKLEGAGFIYIHRSALVRSSFIDRLVHQRRKWVARLKDGSEQPVGKVHLLDVLSELRASSSTSGRTLANEAQPDEKPASHRRLQAAR